MIVGAMNNTQILDRFFAFCPTPKYSRRSIITGSFSIEEKVIRAPLRTRTVAHLFACFTVEAEPNQAN